MKKTPTILLTLISLLWACTPSGQKPAQQKKENVKPKSALPHEATIQPDASSVRERVMAIYEDLGKTYYGDEQDTLARTKYFSMSLLSWWNQLPDDDLVIDFDPWICAQDYDTVYCEKVEAVTITEDSAYADVTLHLIDAWSHKLRLSMVLEQHDGDSAPNWYVSDIHMLEEIRDGKAEPVDWKSLVDEMRFYKEPE